MTDEKLSERIEKYVISETGHLSMDSEAESIIKAVEALESERDSLKEQLRNALNDCVFHHKRAEKAEARVKELIGINSGLSELTQGMDYCAEESDKKRQDAEAEVKALTKAYDKVYDELTRTNQAILNHEENKYVVEDLAKTYTRIRDAEDRLSKAQEVLLDNCSNYPKGCDKCVNGFNIPHKDACLTHQIMKALGDE